MFHHSLKPSAQSGFSLIEVMVSMLVMAVGAGSLAILLLSSVQGTAQAQDRSYATIQAANLAQLIHANPASLGHLLNPDTNTDSDDSGCAEATGCTNNWTGDYLQAWQLALEHQIAQSRGLVCRDSSPMDGNMEDAACDGSGDAVVKIVWQESAHQVPGIETRRVVLPLPSQ